MRRLLMGLALAGLLAGAVGADEKKDDTKKEEKKAKLAVGDDAPALAVSTWMQGDEVKSFEKGRVYVVEFWATWCGPCIVMMPHVAELQRQYKKDVTVIGFSAKDKLGNNEERVAEFVKKRGPKLGYTFAYEEGDKTREAWMTAAGRGGIPCAFVVDREGKVAFIGHPMYLDVVLPRVVSGKWQYKEGMQEIEAIEKEVTALFGSSSDKDPAAGLAQFAAFDKKHPALARIPYFTGTKLDLMLKAK